MDNAASRKEIRQKEKAARLAEKNRGIVIINMMADKIGRAYAWDQLATAHVFSTSYSPDALQMAFAEGERNSGLRLLNDIIEWCPEQFIQMMREQNERRTIDHGNDDGNSDNDDSGPDAYPDPGHDVYASIDP